MKIPVSQISSLGATSGDLPVHDPLTGTLISSAGGDAISRWTLPSSIWSNQVAQQFIREIENSGGGAPMGANDAVFIPFLMPQNGTIKRICVYNGSTATGNIDVGLYDTAGVRLVSSGSTARAGSLAVQVFDISDTLLSPGHYYMAVAVDSIFQSFKVFAEALVRAPGLVLGMKTQSSAFPLPSNATFADPSTISPLLCMSLLLEA